jgi:hypothetical protein
MCLPNLVIAGAPKCGTSSLFQWLAGHPEVCGSNVKEPFYLMDRGHPLLRKHANVHDDGLAGYRRYFSHCEKEKRIIVEATTHYLYQRTALDVLSGLTPVPQIIFLLREPARRVFSSYEYTKYNLSYLDRGISFHQLVEGILSGSEDFIAQHCASVSSAYVLRNDIQYSRYMDYIEKWVERLGKKQIMVYLFEEMIQQPRRFMLNLAERLGIDPSYYETYAFQQHNQTVFVKNPLLHRRLRKLAALVPAGMLKERLKTLYFRRQGHSGREEMSSKDRDALLTLARDFRPYNARLAQEFQLNILSWG